VVRAPGAGPVRTGPSRPVASRTPARRGDKIPLVIIAAPAAFSADDRPQICQVNGEYTVQLSSAMSEVLKEYDWNFVILKSSDFYKDVIRTYSFTEKQTPFAVIGDFNGDEVLDVILLGHDRKYVQLLGIVSSANGFEIVPVLSYPWTEPGEKMRDAGLMAKYLAYVPPRRVESAFEGFPLELKTDAFELLYFKKSSVLYYYENGVFNQYTTGD
jgi:hypothetical protein